MSRTASEVPECEDRIRGLPRKAKYDVLKPSRQPREEWRVRIHCLVVSSAWIMSAGSLQFQSQQGGEEASTSCSTVPIENRAKARHGLGMMMDDVE